MILGSPPTEVAAGNLISGNAGPGVHLVAPDNGVYANWIGTDATGAAALPNADEGILVEAGPNTIGNDTVGGNVIAGNDAQGITVDDPFFGGGVAVRKLNQGDVMTTRVGIMGFGRIGRNIFRILSGHPSIEVVAIVDISEFEGLEYLLRFDKHTRLRRALLRMMERDAPEVAP